MKGFGSKRPKTYGSGTLFFILFVMKTYLRLGTDPNTMTTDPYKMITDPNPLPERYGSRSRTPQAGYFYFKPALGDRKTPGWKFRIGVKF
jgi:hypothetical protein